MQPNEVIETLKYKVTGAIPVFDQDGNHNGFLEIDSIQEVPQQLGDGWVENNLAELVVTEEPDLNMSEEEVKEEGVADYKITGVLPVFDNLGSVVAPVGIGEIRTYPVSVGQSLVEQGLAEKVEEEE